MRRAWLLCALGSILAAKVLAAAEDPWNGPAMSAKPDELLRLATAAPAPKDIDIELLFEEHTYQLDLAGRQTRSVRRVFRYLTDKGVEDWSYTEADWSPWREERPVIHARVVTPDGQVRSLDPESIGEVPVEQDNPNLLSDQKMFRAPLPAIQVGAIVEEEIINREIRPLFDHGAVERLLLADSHPIRKLRVVIDYPAALPLRYEVLGTDLKPVRTEREGRVKLLFDAGAVPAQPAVEPYLPPEVCRWPEVVFATGRSWADVAAGYSTLAEAQLDPEAVKPLVQEILGEEKARDKVVARLLAAVRNQVRYTGVEFGKAAIVPRAPRETLARRYGDCKDQSAVLAAMLRAAGIPAQLALLRSGKYSDVVPGLPGLGDFDHCIVYLPGDQPLWIDPSSRCTPAGQLPLTDQSRWAMVAQPQTRELVRTPRFDYRQNTSHEDIEIFLSEFGRSRVCVSAGATGSCEEDLRENYASQSVKELRKAWREFFKDDYHTQSLAKLEYSAPLELSKPFRVAAETGDARIGQYQDTDATISLVPEPLFDRLPGWFKGLDTDADGDDGHRTGQPEPGERRTTMLLPEPHVRQLQFRVTPPPGFVPRKLPENSVQQFGPATISQTFERTDENVLVATFRIDTGPGTFTAAEANALRQGISELSGGDTTPWELKIGLEHVAAKRLAAGRVKEALAEYGRLLRKHADKAELHQRYAQALLKAGLGEAARDEARRAVDLAPKSAAAHAALARILTYDLLGRHFCSGMDWPAAAVEYRKALELDPSDATARMDFAILLEHNGDGVRYSPDSKLEDALVEYRKARKQLGVHHRLDQLEINLAMVLLVLEQYADLEKLAADSEMSATWKSLLVAAVAAQRGPAEAERKAAELGSSPEERRTVLAAAGDYLDQTRLYSQAAAVLQAAAVGSSDSATLLEKAKTLASLRRFGEAGISHDGPRRLVQQLFLAVLVGGKRREQVPSLFVKSAEPRDVATVMDELAHALRPLLDEERDNQIPPQRMADVLSVLEITCDGDDAAGYRLRAVDEDVKDLAWYVVLEEGNPRLLPAGPGDANLGLAAIARLEKGDPAGAKRWLQWAAEKQPPRAAAHDPFAGSPFANLWRGAEQEGADGLRLAAAALAAQGGDPRAAIPLLVAARQTQTAPKDSLQIDRALCRAYLSDNRPAEAIRAADRILKQTDRPHEPLRFKMTALGDLGRWDELRQVLHAQMEKADNSQVIEELLALQAMRLGDFDTAETRLRPLADRAKVAPAVLNNLAWNAMSRGSVGQRALDDALAAATRTSFENSACLHTLAAVDAELGKTTEALENLRRGILQRGGQIKEIDWYVLGRIAEQYGLDETAAGLYRKIPSPKRPAADDVYTLAQQRLKKLAKP